MQTLTTALLLADTADGSPIDRVVLVRDVEQRTKRDGATFLRMTLADRSARVAAVMWDAGDVQIEAGAHPMHVVGRIADHPRFGRQVTVSSLVPVPSDDVAWVELLDAPQRATSELEHDLSLLLGSIDDEDLSALLHRILGADTVTGRRFRELPAAKYHHHAYPHGLLDHSVQVAQLVSSAAATLADVDRDLAVAGALLHDIGKLEAYDFSGGCADLADAGKLIGEIPLGFYRVRRDIEAMPGFAPERAQALLHVILSHHGRLEFGSPVAPCTREATLVHAMDELSGRMGAYDRLVKETASEQPWSRFDRVLETSAFLG